MKPYLQEHLYKSNMKPYDPMNKNLDWDQLSYVTCLDIFIDLKPRIFELWSRKEQPLLRKFALLLLPTYLSFY